MEESALAGRAAGPRMVHHAAQVLNACSVGTDGLSKFDPVKRTSLEDRWKIVSPSDPFSTGDPEVTPAEFACAQRGRGAKSIQPLSAWRGRRPASLHPTQSRTGAAPEEDVSEARRFSGARDVGSQRRL